MNYLLRLLSFGILFSFFHTLPVVAENQLNTGLGHDLILVEKGKPRAVILVGDQNPDLARQAAQSLQETIEKASSVKLPIIEDISSVSNDQITIIVGGGKLAQSRGVDINALPTEGYRIKTGENYVIFAGHDIDIPHGTHKTSRYSRATLWAIDYYLDRYLGVKWLWPGEFGTYVPEHEMVSIPNGLDISLRPSLDKRLFLAPDGRDKKNPFKPLLSNSDYGKLYTELDLWKSHHQAGDRTSFVFGHSFRDWWEKYHAKHPDYFAEPLPGYRQPFPNQDRVKLRLSNPAVSKQIIDEWRAEGAPDNWNVCPNDGNGFDIDPDTLAWDYPPRQDVAGIWHGRANLTHRYIIFWNQLLDQMKHINPRATLSTYAYSAYRYTPQNIRLKNGIAVEFVSSYEDYENWTGWRNAGAILYLRPNWSYIAAGAPHLPILKETNYLKFAIANGMQGFELPIIGDWSTQGFNYYLFARLTSRPELSLEEVLAEYLSAFGKAAPMMREYIDYWHNFTEKVAFSTPVGGVEKSKVSGFFEEVGKKRGSKNFDLQDHARLMPDLYTDTVIEDAEKILQRAEAATKEGSLERARVNFLQMGLLHLRKTRDFIALLSANKSPKHRSKLKEDIEELQQLRTRLTLSHVINGDYTNLLQHKYGLANN